MTSWFATETELVQKKNMMDDRQTGLHIGSCQVAGGYLKQTSQKLKCDHPNYLHIVHDTRELQEMKEERSAVRVKCLGENTTQY